MLQSYPIKRKRPRACSFHLLMVWLFISKGSLPPLKSNMVPQISSKLVCFPHHLGGFYLMFFSSGNEMGWDWVLLCAGGVCDCIWVWLWVSGNEFRIFVVGFLVHEEFSMRSAFCPSLLRNLQRIWPKAASFPNQEKRLMWLWCPIPLCYQIFSQ